MRLLILLPIILLLGACSITPQTNRERLVILEYSYQGALGTVQDMVASGLLTGDDLIQVETLVIESNNALQNARVTLREEDGLFSGVVNTANDLIFQLITFLNSQKGDLSWAPIFSLPSEPQLLSSPS